MAEVPRDFKIVLVEEKLPEHQLGQMILHCSNRNQLDEILEKHHSSLLFIVCSDGTLLKISPSLKGSSNIGTLFILSEGREIMWPYDLEERTNFPWVQINTPEQLMRHLYLKAMYCYIQQGNQHNRNGDNGLANLCFLDAKKALEQTAVVV